MKALGFIGRLLCFQSQHYLLLIWINIVFYATRLAFDHPTTGERIDVVSPLPEDLLRALALLGCPQSPAPLCQRPRP